MNDAATTPADDRPEGHRSGDDHRTEAPDQVENTGTGGGERRRGHEIRVRGDDSTPLLYRDLSAPTPIEAAPPVGARLVAFGSILVGGLLGALIGYGTAEIMTGSSLWAAVGAVVGAAGCAVGVGIVANLALRAMNEWHTVQHPEAAPEGTIGSPTGSTPVADDAASEAGRSTETASDTEPSSQ